MASVDYYYKKNMTALDENMKKSIADNNTIHENQAKSTKDKYNAQIDLSNQEYDDSLRTNEVQKYINMREVAENNANLGLTDSGLNRTQSTAVQVSASNNAAKIERDRTNMVAALTGEMNRYLAEIENNKISSEASIRQGYESKAMEAAQSSYKADVDAAAKIEAERIAAQNAASKEARTALTTLITDFGNNNYTKDQAAKKVKTYIDLYGVDENTLSILLENAGLEKNEYAGYIESGTTVGATAQNNVIKEYKKRYGADLTYLQEGGLAINGRKIQGYELINVQQKIANLNKPVVTKLSDKFIISPKDGPSQTIEISGLPQSVVEQLTEWSKGNYVLYELTPWGKQ